MRRKLWALLLTIMMVATMVPASAFADDDEVSSYAGSSSVDHIDIGVNMTAELTIGGKTLTSDVQLKTSDASNVNVTAVQDGKTVDFTRTGVSTSTDSSGKAQVRLKGTFPVGTKANPVVYTVSFTTDVTFVDGDKTYTVPMTFTSTFNYWSTDNVCPGLAKNKTEWQNGSVIKGSGMDFELGASASKGTVTITKEVKDEDGNYLDASGQSYTFNIYNASGTKVDTVTVKPGADGIGIGVAYLDYGTYYIEEASPVSSLTIDNAKYEYSGTEITYTVSGKTETVERTRTGNFTLSSDAAKITFTASNIYAPEKVTISGTKSWEDNGNQDGIRPDKITVKLTGTDGSVRSVEATAQNGWKYEFKDLPKYSEDKKEIVYTVSEEAVAGYTPSVTGYDLTNTHIPATIDISGTKTWDDADNQDNKRPESITVNLLADGIPVASKTVTADADGKWAYTFAGVPKYKDGVEIQYTVTEGDVSKIGYTGKITGYNITNSYTPETTSVKVVKSWDDNGNQDGIRPDNVTVKLLADEQETDKTLVLNAANSWTGSFTGLAKYNAGKLINYSVAEVKVTGYETSIDWSIESNAFIVSNTHTPATIDISGSKTWEDNSNQDGIRPTSITVNLLANGTKVASKTVTAADNWAYSFENQPKYENGVEIKYTVTEDAVKGYDEPVINGYNITNTHTPATIDISGSKTWEDAGNQDGIRPTSITVNLLADDIPVASKTVTAADNWAYSFENQPKYKNGVEIKYTVTEDAVAGYDTDINGYNITNTHTPATISISGTKTWDDADNQDNKRPDSVTIKLLVNGEKIAEKTVTAADGWAYSFENLPKYNNGTEIVYTLTEDPVAEYAPTYDGYNITNTHAPGKVSVSVLKVWNDGGDQDGLRPDDVTIKLLANEEDTGKTLTLSSENGWVGSFTDLDEYSKGTKIKYTVAEDTVEGYEEPVITGDAENGYTVTNKHTPVTFDISGTKTWNDGDDQDRIRPDKITVKLIGSDNSERTAEATAEGNWSYKFENLPKYNKGTEIEYEVTEVEVEGYVSKVNGYDIVNTHAPEQISIPVEKVWEDAGNQDGIRPNDVTVTLLANGDKTDKTIVLNNGNNWKAAFENLDKYKNGELIEYTVTEETVEGYEEPVITGDVEKGYTVTNRHVPETTDISGTKSWEDNGNNDGMRPESVIINLLADGVKIDSATVSEETGWKYEFKDLPVYKEGKIGQKVDYTISENEVSGYVPDSEVTDYDVTNTHDLEKTSVLVNKTWEDNDNQDGIRPDEIVVRLYANGEPTGDELTITAENGWIGVFDDLNKYKSGREIEYTVKEDAVEGYDTDITDNDAGGFTIINTHIPETTVVEGTKTWDDNDNQDGKRPDEITVKLLANGQEIDSVTVDAEDNWQYSFEDLPKYENQGNLISYTVLEKPVKGYQSTVEGYDITNSYTPGKVSVSVVKSWQDNNDRDGIRPDEITVRLFADGEDTGEEVILSEENNWAAAFTDLDEYKDGEAVEYTVEEDAVDDYNTVITGDADNGYVVTNSHTPEKQPKTGDSFNITAAAGAGIAALLLALAVFFARRRRNA